MIEGTVPVLINILDLIDLLLNALTGDAIGLQLIDLLVNQVGDGFVEILQEVLDDLWDDVVGLLLILSLIGKVSFWITCMVKEEEGVMAKLAVRQYPNSWHRL